MSALSSKQILLIIVICFECADPEPRFRSNNNQNEISDSSRSSSYRGRQLCPKVTTYLQSKKGSGCVSKYECKNKCEEKIQCKTKYEYKCTDYRRQECKNVWQNVCNGKKRKRNKRSSDEALERSEVFSEPQGPPIVNSDDAPLSRVKRLIPTEVVYDQSYPVPPSDLPFASETAGQIFDFASPPLSRSCWRNVRKCEWKKYRSQCRNEPTKVCDDKPKKTCKRKCARAYYCFKCPSASALVTTPKPSIGPPSPPPAGTFISPPAPPNRLDSIVDVKKQNGGKQNGGRRAGGNRRRGSAKRKRRP